MRLSYILQKGIRQGMYCQNRSHIGFTSYKLTVNRFQAYLDSTRDDHITAFYH